MLRYNVLMLALGGLTMAAVAPRDPADAQSGHALVLAENACLEYDVAPGTPAFENCVVRAAKAFDRGEPDIAYGHARSAREARDVCRSKGAAPDTLDYGQCLTAQVELRNKH